MAKGKTKVLTSARPKKMGPLTPRFRYWPTSTRKLDSNVIDKRADMNKVKPI